MMDDGPRPRGGKGATVKRDKALQPGFAVTAAQVIALHWEKARQHPDPDEIETARPLGERCSRLPTMDEQEAEL